MREIKFRTWNNKDKELIIWKHITESGYYGWFSSEQFIPMQYTGLKDKNGKDIYEGDIVEAQGQNERYLQVIEFHNTRESCGRGWIGRNIKQLANPVNKTPEKNISDRFSYFCWPTTWEVIGNIYENPGLIEVKGEQV